MSSTWEEFRWPRWFCSIPYWGCGSGHLFADPDLPEYDRASSEEMWRRVLAFLDRIDARGSDVEREAR